MHRSGFEIPSGIWVGLSIISFMLFIYMIMALTAGEADHNKTQPDVIQSSNGVTVVTLNSGTKIVKFDDGRVTCFDKWGSVCEDFDSKIVVNVPNKTLVVK